MSKHVSASRFSRLLQELNTPVYVLNEMHTLIYCNDALVQWTNVDADALIGQTCRYHTSTSRLHHEIVAASLAAPPEVERGQRTETILAVDTAQEIRYRRAEFIPLALGDGMFGILVLVDAVDLEPNVSVGACPRMDTQRGASPAANELLQARELHRLLFALRRHQAGRYRLETLIGHAPAMQQARQQAMLAAETIAPVLIVGPPGSGRETLAGAIHYGRDGERSGGMIPVDCHALPSELIDSTIRAFYRRYAGADQRGADRREADKTGDRQQRHTLLLNNADLLEPGLAELVVAVLANNPGNMRIIGTSPVEPGAWQNHPALPFHLATITIHLPPLIERRADIPLLAQWFLEQQNARKRGRLQASGFRLQDEASNTKSEVRSPKPEVRTEARSPKPEVFPPAQRTGFAADALDLLTLYHWPGNLDELVQVVEESHANARGTLVRANDLPVRLRQAADAQAVGEAVEPIDLENFMLSVELELIQRALKVARGNKAKAARLLGMTRPRLYRRLEQLGLIEVTTPKFGAAEQKDASRADTPDFREPGS